MDEPLETIEDFVKAIGGEEKALAYVNNMFDTMFQRIYRAHLRNRYLMLLVWCPFGIDPNRDS